MTDLIFADENTDKIVTAEQAPWNILLVDDEPGVHQVTQMVLRDFTFDNRSLNLISAYSGREGYDIMASRSDIALAIVDVVMESDHAGLELVQRIREDLHNNYTRLVLRTGQPGQAPEEDVITSYDIDDYKDKTELTSNKLLTLMYASLRSYRDICVIDSHRRSLEQVILASTEIFEASSLKTFASAVLKQICNLLNLDGAIFYCTSLNEDVDESDDYRVLAVSGKMEEFETKHKSDLPDEVLNAFEYALKKKGSYINGDIYTGYFSTSLGSENLLYVSMERELDDMDKQLLDIYASNVAVTYENLLLRDEILDTQRELAYILGEAVEQRSKETGSHVRRVALYSHLFATKYGLEPQLAELIKLASPLHDVGKIAIPDSILKKPGKLDDQEWAIMQTHAQMGADLLHSNDNEVVKMGSIIAGQHHERWDGTGYPKQLKEEDIHIAGRITALADVFDALGCKRYYKEAWALEDILAEIDKQKGKQFDPKLVEILHENIDEVLRIRDLYPD
jgi:response regulator RpfG family c-di-GMP phosphodiesterase